MKKGKKYSKSKILLFTIFKSRFFLGLGFLGAALASLLKVVAQSIELDALMSDSVSSIFKTSDFWELIMAIILFIGSAVGAARSFYNLYNDYLRHRIIKKEYRSSLAANITQKISPKYEDCGYKWQRVSSDIILFSDEVNRCLKDNSRNLHIDVDSRKLKMNGKQRKLIYRIVKEKIDNGVEIFNSDLVKLCDDMMTQKFYRFDQNNCSLSPLDMKRDNSEQKTEMAKALTLDANLRTIKLKKTDYFSNISSNDLIFTRVFGLDGDIMFEGKQMSLDFENTLYDLSQSPSANIVGVNTLAITAPSDDEPACVIINRQANNNDVNNDSFVPSGSGSADFDDLKSKKGFLSSNALNDSERKEVLSQLQKTKNILNDEKNQLKQIKSQVRTVWNDLTAAKKSKDTEQANALSARLTELKKNYSATKNLISALIRHVDYLDRVKNYRYSFGDFIAGASERELEEESYIEKSDIISTVPCGFCRLLSRGGKPDFFCLSFLNKTASEYKKNFKEKQLEIQTREMISNKIITDYSEVAEQIYVPVSELISDDPEKPSLTSLCVKYGSDLKAEPSVQLLFSIRLLSLFYSEER